jgi:hypothetical protein
MKGGLVSMLYGAAAANELGLLADGLGEAARAYLETWFTRRRQRRARGQPAAAEASRHTESAHLAAESASDGLAASIMPVPTTSVDSCT